MGPEVLGHATAALRIPTDPRLIVGFNTADDAGVVRLPDGRLLIQTLDFFTPIVDDPYTFGAIAAANALSDVYAMGGVPLSAMNILCWPHRALPVDALTAVLQGGADKVAEAGAMVVGGHSVQDKELKFGLSVSGVLDAGAPLWTNAGAQPGDALVLTKPVGTGIIATAVKRSACPEAAETAATQSMLRLNRGGRDAAAAGVVHGCTDITGNGLVGHGWELAAASGVRVVLHADQVPLLPHVLELAAAGHITGGDRANRAYVGDGLRTLDVPPALLSALLDPQTSGGLLFALPQGEATRMVAAGAGHIVGTVDAGEPGVHVILGSGA